MFNCSDRLHNVRTPQPSFIACEELLWLKADGSETRLVARLGLPYLSDEDIYRCPVELTGLDGRYSDMAGMSSMQALCLASKLLMTRLTHLLETGERLVHLEDRSPWDAASLAAVFGQ